MNETDYMIDAMAADLIALLMERKGWDMDKICDVLYNTDTFAKLSRGCFTKVPYMSIPISIMKFSQVN